MEGNGTESAGGVSKVGGSETTGEGAVVGEVESSTPEEVAGGRTEREDSGRSSLCAFLTERDSGLHSACDRKGEAGVNSMSADSSAH